MTNKSHKDKIVYYLDGSIKKDHGNLLFIDLRDNYGFTQCVIDKKNSNFQKIEKLKLETVIKIEGLVLIRSSENIIKNYILVK